MLVLKTTATARIEIKKSVFFVEAFYTVNMTAARTIIKQQKEKYINARHVVHAFVIGKAGEILGCSDDGEPVGTAGKPVLAVLVGSGITNITVTVARRFGGILLGTGGLVRAYSAAVKEVLAVASTEPLIEKQAFLYSCTYPDYQKIQRIMAGLSITLENTEFSDIVTVTGTVSTQHGPVLSARIAEFTKGFGTIIFSPLKQ